MQKKVTIVHITILHYALVFYISMLYFIWFICGDVQYFFFNSIMLSIQGVTGGTDQTLGECSLGHTIPI